MTYQEVKSLTQIVQDLSNEIGVNKADSIIKTGFAGLDKNYFGIAPTEFWTVGGYTSSGKSFFMIQLLLNIARQGKKILFFSLEMSRNSIASRLWANLSNINSSKLEWGNLNLEESGQRDESKQKLEELGKNVFIVDTVYSLKEINKIVAEIQPDIVFIDYLQNLQSNTAEYEKLTSASAQIQLMAKKYNCGFVCASQVSNAEQKEGVNNSNIIGLKGSGAIASASDFVVWIEKKVDYSQDSRQLIDLFVRKSRRGAVRRFDCELIFPSGRFLERNDL